MLILKANPKTQPLKMPIQLINSFASWVLKQRIHQIELFLKYPNEVQDELLMNLIQSAKNTGLGKEYDYASINSYTTFEKGSYQYV
jgi:hypothetical protein